MDEFILSSLDAEDNESDHSPSHLQPTENMHGDGGYPITEFLSCSYGNKENNPLFQSQANACSYISDDVNRSELLSSYRTQASSKLDNKRRFLPSGSLVSSCLIQQFEDVSGSGDVYFLSLLSS